MDPSMPRDPASDPARRREAAGYVSTAKDHLAAGKSEHNMESCWQLVNKALSIDPCAHGGNAILIAIIALRATEHGCFPSGNPEPYAVFGLTPTVPAARVESYYRQASELLTPRCHPSDPCSKAFTEAVSLVADAWDFLSDPVRKAALDSAYEALAAAEFMPKRPTGPTPAAKRQKRLGTDDEDDDGNSKDSAIDLDKLDRFCKIQVETSADGIKVLKLQQKLPSDKLEERKLILEAKKVEKELKMMDAYNNLISQDTSSMSDEEKAERVHAMKCLRKAFFPETI